MKTPQYLNLLKTCTSINQLKQIHAQTITKGLTNFTYITSNLLTSYSSLTSITQTQSFFQNINTPTTFDYNTMISLYSKTSRKQMGIFIYNQMCLTCVKSDSFTYPLLVKCCECLWSVKNVHGLVFKVGYVSDVFVVSGLICMYCSFKEVGLGRKVFDECVFKNVVCWTSLISGLFGNGCVEDARKLFGGMCVRNDVSYSAMVSGFVRNGCFNEAIEFFGEMTTRDVIKPNRSILMSVLSACGVVGAFDVGRRIHCELVGDSFSVDVELGTALIDFNAKCGYIELAEDVFGGMDCKDVATWSAMVLGLATNGKNKMAIELFEEMEQKGPVPNDITFVAVLVACNHKTLVNEAWRLLGRMIKVYGIRPSIEHYGCMVDLLTRSGQLKGAEILIRLMPMEPDGAIWGSFLQGCLTHGETDLSESAGKRLLELEPQHSGRYVLLANMYANMGSWEGVINLRNMMKKRKVDTAPGWSFIEVDGIAHKFLVSDQCHPQVKDLHEILQLLNKFMN